MIIDREYILKDMAETNSTVVISFSIAMFLLLILLLVLTYNSKCEMDNAEKFNGEEHEPNSVGQRDLLNRKMDVISQGIGSDIKASDPLGDEVYKPVEENYKEAPPKLQDTQISGKCVSRDRLTSADLLPLDANSKWAELNPQCSGDVQDQNYLTAGYHIGINTVGQSMRNANLQLRYEPPNPQVPVSPWLISTIEPDSRTHGLMDIGSAPVYK